MSVLQEVVVFLCGFILMKSSRAQVVLPGPCPTVQAMTNIDAARYLGKWYEAEKYFFLFEFGGKCITANYYQKENGAIGVVNKQINLFTGAPSEIRGEATKDGESDEAKFIVRFPSLPVDIPAPYWVVDTDYDSYAVVWSCNDLKAFHTRNSWILTREQNPPQAVLDKAYKVALRNGITKRYFIPTDQKDCPQNNSV